MKVVFTILLCLFAGLTPLWAASVSAVNPGHHAAGSLDQTWGPDAFGYTAKDTAAVGGPDYRWFDISTTGTAVTGLGDDNVVGPFPLGFTFHYYWYDVDQFWIGSNGYIKFSPTGQISSSAAGFPHFPDATDPDDVLGVYLADWIFSGADPSQCHRWTNGTDTLIVSWSNIVAWVDGGPNDGNHNFQIILSAADSSITYMYGAQTGAVSNDWTSVGFENVTGALGLSLIFDTYVLPNTAIKIEYPDVVTYAIHDLSLASLHNLGSQAIFLRPGTQFSPWFAVRNSGNQDEGTFNLSYMLRRANNQVVAQNTSSEDAIAANAVLNVTLDNLWTVDTTRNLRAVATVTRAGDMIATNNMETGEVHTVTLGAQPAELAYDDGFCDDSLSWAGGAGGMGNYFVPPCYPVEVTSLRYFIASNIVDDFGAVILDDDGPNGGPGTVLFTTTVSGAADAAWAVVNVPTPVQITSGGFYVGWMQLGVDMLLGLDSDAPPFSRRLWENTGATWAESRQNGATDAMIRCSIRDLEPAPQPFARVWPADSSVVGVLVDTTLFFAWRQAVDPDDEDVQYRVHLWSPDAAWFDETTLTVEAPDTTLSFPLTLPASSLDEINWIHWTVIAVSGNDTTWAANGQGRFSIDTEAGVEAPGSALVITDYAVNAYPNPFNPTTRIGYDLPAAGEMTLKVYNLLGEEVTTLINGRHEAGRFSVEWNGALAPSGTYFAVLQTATATRVHKLLLLK